jgi:hypothetical protein
MVELASQIAKILQEPQGEFQRTPGQWLRWCDQNGHWVLTETEQERRAKEQERRAKERERYAKEQERRRADRLACRHPHAV